VICTSVTFDADCSLAGNGANLGAAQLGEAMAYTLDAFCHDSRACLAAHPDQIGRNNLRGLLEKLLADQAFLKQHVLSAPPGRHTIYEDPDHKFCVLVHVNEAAGKSPPHDHGKSWAIYGQATGYTDMTEYNRTDGSGGAGKAVIDLTKSYRLEPGKVGLYDVGVIHAIDYPEGARFVRVTGEDLERVPRLKFDTDTHQAIVIESASANA
jgi:hypothetical protein